MSSNDTELSATALITGARGFLGRYVSRGFKSSGWTVIGLGRGGSESGSNSPDCDEYITSDLSIFDSALGEVLTTHEPDICIHLAAPASVPNSFKAPVQDFTAQLSPFLNLLNHLRVSSPKTKVLLISSAAVYGDPASLPVREDQKLSPLSPYGYHKLHQELLLDQYSSLYGLRGCKARIFSTYGEGLRRLAVWDITKRAMNGDRTLHGSGDESRDYLHVSDVAQGLICIAQQASFGGEAINVASGCETKITDLAKSIYQLLGVRGNVELVGRNGAGTGRDPVRWHADITKLKDLGFAPRISLEAGLSSTVSWIKSNE